MGESKLHANLRPREGSAPSAPTLFGGQRRVCCACASCGHGEASMRGAAWHHATHSASQGTVCVSLCLGQRGRCTHLVTKPRGDRVRPCHDPTFFFSRGEDGSLERCVSFPKLLNSWRKTVHIRSHLMLPVTPGPWRTREVNLPKTPKVAQPGRGPGRLGSGGGVPPPHSSDFPIEPPGVTCVSDERRRGHRPPGPQGVTGHGA